MTPDQAADAIRNSAGRFIGCDFIKADGTPRVMRCRWAVVEEVKEHRERAGCLTVWDIEKKAWRSIRIDSLIAIRIDGKSEAVSSTSKGI
jgi:hypothetical protein